MVTVIESLRLEKNSNIIKPNLISKCISSCLGLASQEKTHKLQQTHRVAPTQMLPGLESRGWWRILTSLCQHP